MRKKITLLLCLTLFSLNYVFSQTYETKTLIKTTKYLNGGARSYLGGVSRLTLLVDLPPNTVQWYYSFTTTAGESGTDMLNLAFQISAAATTGPLGATVAKNLQVPKGSSSLDIWLMPLESKEDFVLKNDDKILLYDDLSSKNTKETVQPINNLLKGSFYLGLRNPSAMDGVNVVIEVVAIVEVADPNADKGKSYGSMGWKCYERGDLSKCVEYSKKALEFNPNLGWVKFNIALVHLAQENDVCVDEYIDAIATCKTDPDPKYTLQGALGDINNLKLSKGTLKNMEDIEGLIKNQLAKY